MKFQKVLEGILAPTNRWKHCVGYVNDNMGLAVGSLFIRENFPKDSKDTVKLDSMRARISNGSELLISHPLNTYFAALTSYG